MTRRARTQKEGLLDEIERLRAENVSLYEKLEALQNQMVQICGEAGDEIVRLRKNEQGKIP